MWERSHRPLLSLVAACSIASLPILAVVSAHAAPNGQVDNGVVLQVTNPQPSQSIRGLTMITGYAGDRRNRSGSGINQDDIQIYLDDSSNAPNPRNLLSIPGASRTNELDERDPSCCHPDLAAALVFRVPWETCTFPAGRHTLTTWVSSGTVVGARNRTSVDFDIAPCADGQVLASNNLDDGTTGSRIRISSRNAQAYSGVPASITRVYGNFAMGIDARCEVSSDCFYSIRIRSTPGPNSIVNRQGRNNEYGFAVSPRTGRYIFVYAPREGTPDVLIPWTNSSAIQRGTATNRMAVIAQDDIITLFVNGQPLAQVQDDRRPWGDIRWYGHSDDTGDVPVEVRFSNVIISTTGPVDMVSRAVRGN